MPLLLVHYPCKHSWGHKTPKGAILQRLSNLDRLNCRFLPAAEELLHALGDASPSGNTLLNTTLEHVAEYVFVT